jgi:hypothetical protein
MLGFGRAYRRGIRGLLRGEPGLWEGGRVAEELFRCGVEVSLWVWRALTGETWLLVTDGGGVARSGVLAAETRRSAEGMFAARAP